MDADKLTCGKVLDLEGFPLVGMLTVSSCEFAVYDYKLDVDDGHNVRCIIINGTIGKHLR